MILLSICATLLAIGLIMQAWSDGSNDDLHFAGVLVCVIGGACLVIGILAFPITYLTSKSTLVEYQAFKTTLSTAREKGTITEVERAAIFNHIVQWNERLAGYKYWNTTLLDRWVPDVIAELPLLE